MFYDVDPDSNGEIFFYSFIQSNIDTIFDVGCRDDSIFKNFNGIVHYFDPIVSFIDKLKNISNFNKISYYNNIALSDRIGEMDYYPRYQSLYNRIATQTVDDDANKQSILVTTGFDYLKNNNINKINFLKIDVEGHEFSVIKSFKESISCIDIIQFEYGGTYIDAEVKLIDIKNYLNGIFNEFYYLTNKGIVLITNFEDHYRYCNIVCFNKDYDFCKYKDIILQNTNSSE